MKLREISEALNAQVFSGQDLLDCEIDTACGSDLMSDVMAYVTENVVLLTGLINLQTVRTAEMMDIKAIIFVRGKTPIDSMIELATEKKIVLMSTKFSMFVSCGILYKEGLKSGYSNPK